MRRLLTLLPLLFLFSVIHAQTLQPNVIAANGGVSQNEKIALEWTLGEPFIEGITGKDRNYTEGFHQPVIVIGNIESPTAEPTSVMDEKYGITVFPNPVRIGLTIDMSRDMPDNVRLQLMSADGRPVISEKIDPVLQKTELDLSSLVPGNYMLWFTTTKGERLASFNISKI